MSSKISSQIMLLIKNLQISKSDERTIDLIISNLIIQNKEYQRKPQGLLRKVVKETLSTLDLDVFVSQAADLKPEYLVADSSRFSTNLRSSSLNDTLSSLYQNAPTKRSTLNEGENLSALPAAGDCVRENSKAVTHSEVYVETSKPIQSVSLDVTDKEEKHADSSVIKAKKRSRRALDTSADKYRKKVNTEDSIEYEIESAATKHIVASNVKSFLVTRPITRLSDLAGIESVIAQIRELVFYPVQYPRLYRQLRVSPPTGLLLHGPSGCGKTSLALAIAGELGFNFFKASGPELIGGTSGESEERIREVFTAAITAAPSVLFLDSIDVIAGKREASQRGMDRRVVAQLLDCIDLLPLMHQSQRTSNGGFSVSREDNLLAEDTGDAAEGVDTRAEDKFVVLIAATNRPDTLDTSLRGRFDREIALPVPDAAARAKILRLVTQDMALSTDLDFDTLGRSTPGFVGADLRALAREAGVLAVRRILECASLYVQSDVGSPGESIEDVPLQRIEDGWFLFGRNLNLLDRPQLSVDCEMGGCNRADALRVPEKDCKILMADMLEAAKGVQPSAKREGFAVVPDVTWADVGALAEVREELLTNVLEPIAHPDRYRSLGLEVPAGVLFFGPPGCGKTLLAKAVANQSGANFISVKGPELLNMYVGESESKVRQVFSRARSSAPCVIFFDELDALCPRRSSGGESGSGVSERVVNQMLTELDGLESRKDVYIIAATNRLELIDDAMLRPGRLGKLLYVPLPSADDRVAILHSLTRKLSLHTEVDAQRLHALGHDIRTEGYSGADLAALVREAGMAVVREWRESDRTRLSMNETSVPQQALSPTPQATTLDPHGGLDEGRRDADGDRSMSLIGVRHFEEAMQRVKPSVSLHDRRRYERVHQLIQEGKGAVQALRDAQLLG